MEDFKTGASCLDLQHLIGRTDVLAILTLPIRTTVQHSVSHCKYVKKWTRLDQRVSLGLGKALRGIAMLTCCEHSAAPEVLQSFTELVERSSVVPEVAPEEPAAEARVAGLLGFTGAGPGGVFAGRLPQPRKRPPRPLEALKSVT